MAQTTRKAGQGVVMVRRELSPLEQTVARRWFRGATSMEIYRMRARSGGGLFCVHHGSLGNVPDRELRDRLQLLLESGSGEGPAAMALNAELARRLSARLHGTQPGPSGPDAA